MAQPAPTYPVDLATETPDAREARLVWERARIAEAQADFAAGRYLEGEEAEQWLKRELAEAQAAFDQQGD